MRSPLILFRCVAKALINAAVQGGPGGDLSPLLVPAGDLIVDVLPAVARDLWHGLFSHASKDERRAAIEAVAQTGAAEARELAAQAVADEGGDLHVDLPENVRQFIIDYLSGIPAATRASLRRPDDPTGTSVPDRLVPRSENDLLRLLPARLPRFQAGEQPDGLDYILEQLLGTGGFGEVWKARHAHTTYRPRVALKFCLDASAAQLLRNEVALLDRLMSQPLHPGIIQLRETRLNAKDACLIYEYVEGGDLADLVQARYHDSSAGGFAPEEAARVIRDLAEIVGTAHRLDPPIVHRDLKPANILVENPEDDAPRLRVADFGIGGLATRQAVRHTQRGATAGEFLVSAARGAYTPLYASPQQARGEPPHPADDVFALGVIWYQLLNGRLDQGRPGGLRWHRQLAERGMAQALIDLLASCLEDHREDRPPHGQALAEAIEHALAPPTPSLADPDPAPAAAAGGGEPSSGVEQDEPKGGIAPALAPESSPDLPDSDPTAPTSAEEYLARGRARYDKDDYDSAIADYTEAIRINPQYADAYFYRGSARQAKGDLDGAIADYDQAIWIDPQYAVAHHNRGSARQAKGDLDGAIADYDEAIRINPQYADAYYYRGRARQANGDLDGAIADYDEVIRINPKDAFTYYVRGRARQANGDLNGAEKDFAEAIQRARGELLTRRYWRDLDEVRRMRRKRGSGGWLRWFEKG